MVSWRVGLILRARLLEQRPGFPELRDCLAPARRAFQHVIDLRQDHPVGGQLIGTIRKLVARTQTNLGCSTFLLNLYLQASAMVRK
jgi:hypothetical protein